MPVGNWIDSILTALEVSYLFLLYIFLHTLFYHLFLYTKMELLKGGTIDILGWVDSFLGSEGWAAFGFISC